MPIEHSDIGLGEIHKVHNWEYANAAARTGATGFIASDVGKWAKQTDDGTFWELTATTPTWAQRTGTGAPSGTAGGDLGGTYPNPTVAQSSTAFALTGDISPSQLSANTNDWNPTGLSGASTIRFSTDASRDITGLQGGADGRMIILHNIGSQNAVLKDESASSTAGNRFALNADVTLGADQAALLQYDSTSSRWRLVAGPGAASGGSVSGLTTDFIPKAASSTSLNDSVLKQTAADTVKILSSTAKLYFNTDTRFEWNGTVLKLTDGSNAAELQTRILRLDAGGNLSYYIKPDDGILVGAGNKFGFARNSTTATPGAWLQNDSAQRGVIGVYGDFGSGSVGGTFKFKPERPAQITTNKNDYQTATVSKYVFINSDAARDITGFKDTQSPSADFAQDGEERVLLNNGSNNITLKHEDTNSTAQFRFHNSTGADIVLAADQAADLIYDATLSRWRVFKRN